MDDETLNLPAFGAGEFSYVVRAEDVPPNGLRVKFAADAAVCDSLCARLLVDAVKDLSVTAHIVPFGKRGLMANGRVEGSVQQQCGVTLQPIWTSIAIDFTNEFQPADVVEQFVVPEDDFEAEVPDAMDDGAADLGEVATQIFAMEVPAYPRAPEAQFDDHIDADDIDEKPPSPFAALAALKTESDET
jgi:uncharacterized metal-binding protein YceD (DUF177 family)